MSAPDTGDLGALETKLAALVAEAREAGLQMPLRKELLRKLLLYKTPAEETPAIQNSCVRNSCVRNSCGTNSLRFCTAAPSWRQ